MLRVAAIIGLSLLWSVMFLNILWPFSAPWGPWLNLAFMGLIIIHVLEFILFRAKIRASGDPMMRAMMMTMLYGFLYLSSLPKAEDKADS